MYVALQHDRVPYQQGGPRSLAPGRILAQSTSGWQRPGAGMDQHDGVMRVRAVAMVRCVVSGRELLLV